MASVGAWSSIMDALRDSTPLPLPRRETTSLARVLLRRAFSTALGPLLPAREDEEEEPLVAGFFLRCLYVGLPSKRENILRKASLLGWMPEEEAVDGPGCWWCASVPSSVLTPPPIAAAAFDFLMRLAMMSAGETTLRLFLAS